MFAQIAITLTLQAESHRFKSCFVRRLSSHQSNNDGIMRIEPVSRYMLEGYREHWIVSKILSWCLNQFSGRRSVYNILPAPKSQELTKNFFYMNLLPVFLKFTE